MTLDKVPGQLGHLVLKNDGSVISSKGELENDEKIAGILHQIVSTATKGGIFGEVEKVSINYADHSYVISTTSKNIHVVKRSVTEGFA